MGYSPLKGRLCTCSAPVCRSSAMYYYTLLPLDLHVLSLPLAFILSQDQTLHCKCFVCSRLLNSPEINVGFNCVTFVLTINIAIYVLLFHFYQIFFEDFFPFFLP